MPITIHPFVVYGAAATFGLLLFATVFYRIWVKPHMPQDLRVPFGSIYGLAVFAWLFIATFIGWTRVSPSHVPAGVINLQKESSFVEERPRPRPSDVIKDRGEQLQEEGQDDLDVFRRRALGLD